MFVRHLRSNAVAYLALFVALGGTSYAAVQLPKDSVKSKQVKNRSLKAVDFKKGVLKPGPKGKAGATGATGAAGAAGQTGPPGTVKVTNARFTGNLPVGSSAIDVPLSGGSWTQPPGELDLVYGRATVDAPSSAACGGPANFVVFAQVGDDVMLEGSLTAGADAPGTQFDLAPPTAVDNPKQALFPGAANQPRTLIAKSSDGCAGAHFRVRELEIQVVGVR